MADYDAPPGYSSVNSLGPAVLGMVFTSLLFGVSCIQTTLYFKQYAFDWKVHKFVVGLVWLLNLGHVVMIVHGVYWHAVNMIPVSYVIWSFRVAMIINTIVVVLILNLYATWLWKIGGDLHRVLPYCVIAVQIAGFGIAAVVIYASFGIQYYKDIDAVRWEVIFGLASSTAADLFIAMIMAYYLQIGRSGFAGLNSRVGQLFQFIVCSGLATSAVSMTSLVLFAAEPHNEIWMGVEFCLTGVYVNSFMALMNARKRFKDRRDVPFLSAMHTTMRFVDNGRPTRTTFLETHISIQPDPTDSISEGGATELTSHEKHPTDRPLPHFA